MDAEVVAVIYNKSDPNCNIQLPLESTDSPGEDGTGDSEMEEEVLTVCFEYSKSVEIQNPSGDKPIEHENETLNNSMPGDETETTEVEYQFQEAPYQIMEQIDDEKQSRTDNETVDKNTVGFIFWALRPYG